MQGQKYASKKYPSIKGEVNIGMTKLDIKLDENCVNLRSLNVSINYMYIGEERNIIFHKELN